MRAEEWIGKELARLETAKLDRRLVSYPGVGGWIEMEGRRVMNLSSNDYLDLAYHPEVRAASRDFLERYGCGATASRLVSGTLAAHEELEEALAAHKGRPAALVFGSGFLANIGAIPALVGRGDSVIADKLVHASIIDAIVLSRANFYRFRHNDLDHLRSLLDRPAEGRRLVVTESVFSMDGDLAPLTEIVSLAVDHGAMVMVDEAHATGVFGSSGGGLIRECGLEESVNVSMGTLSKALGGYGGFIACSNDLKKLLVNRARGFIYTTGLPPAVVGSALGALKAVERIGDLGTRLLANASAFRRRLRDAGLDTGGSESQIVPVILGDNGRTLAVADRLRSAGILAAAIRPPTVPEGTARLRLSVTLAHTPEDLARAAEAIIEAVAGAGGI